MTTSAQLSILQAIKAVLAAGDALTDSPITEGKTRPVSGDYQSALNLNLTTSRAAIGMTGGRTNWMTGIELEIYARATGATSAYAAIDPILTAAIDRVLSDNTLGGLVMDVNLDEGDTLRWETDEQAEQLGKCTVVFLVLHQTASRRNY